MAEISDEELLRIRRERDLSLRLLSLANCADLEPLLKDALQLILEISGARIAYVEARDIDAGDEAWALDEGCDSGERESIKDRISKGIIAEALLTGKMIQTNSALLDHRFESRASVQRQRIEAVVCAPIGGDAALGVVYLQDRKDGGHFTELDCQLVELFALHLAPLVDRLLSRRSLSARVDRTAELRMRHQLEGIIGRSQAIATVLEQAMLAAPLDISVILRGESGTGKSQLAQVIHRNSLRGEAPFVELNCAAFPESLVESELFGAVAGSHSEARRDREGKIAAAQGGTLFLDEVGELPLSAQAKLLQALHSRSYYPLGASTPRQADVRIIAATNADLERGIEEKWFREDLYFRLQVMPLEIPSLSKRVEDLAELASYLVDRASKQHGLPEFELSKAAVLAIETAEWPGNVRQLQHSIEAAAIRALGDKSSRIEPRHLFPDQNRKGEETSTPTFQDATRAFQERLLRRTLEECSWNVRDVASQLDLARSHVYNLIKAFDLSRDG